MHHRTFLTGLSVLMLAGSVAAAQSPHAQPAPLRGQSAGHAAQGGASAKSAQGAVPAAASSFMREAAQGNVAEAQLATLAEQKASSEEVKALARQIRQDHQQSNQELQQLASTKNVTLPAEPGAAQKSVYAKLEKLSGQNFDQEYVAEMVKEHRTDIAKFKSHANLSDHEVAAFVAKTLPVLQAHLSHAEAAQSSLKGAERKSSPSTAPRSGASTTPPQKGR